MLWEENWIYYADFFVYCSYLKNKFFITQDRIKVKSYFMAFPSSTLIFLAVALYLDENLVRFEDVTLERTGTSKFKDKPS